MCQEYASCEWETPYGRTVSFSDSHREEVEPCLTTHLTISPSHHVSPPTILYPFTAILCQINRSSLTFLIIRFMSCSTTPRRTLPQESGRLQYFGFSSMDCGIVIRDIGTRDSGGWTCRVSATVAGKHQVSADIVRLFVGENSFSL